MDIGAHIMAWRRDKGYTQDALARRANLTRPYLSRLEGGMVDPALSSLRRIAAALNIHLGQLLEDAPKPKRMTRMELDQLARSALQPGTKGALHRPEARVLARLMKERRRALGLYTERAPRSLHPSRNEGKHAARWLRASLGESQWKALLRRIDKLASLHANLP